MSSRFALPGFASLSKCAVSLPPLRGSPARSGPPFLAPRAALDGCGEPGGRQCLRGPLCTCISPTRRPPPASPSPVPAAALSRILQRHSAACNLASTSLVFCQFLEPPLGQIPCVASEQSFFRLRACSLPSLMPVRFYVQLLCTGPQSHFRLEPSSPPGLGWSQPFSLSDPAPGMLGESYFLPSLGSCPPWGRGALQ